ncbi:hypothetical protein GDO86_017064 [Hymenochirus boettgeri]|uniref:FAD-binding PCMH-type domain-containing protein n=1 Tax=Hymenochirus boettgeri TaxID=247094 RepID=A0A8T2IIA2_9PIPI|nr:hypothetical protein GDO86_017064 [Hymenochirus boettgeri]
MNRKMEEDLRKRMLVLQGDKSTWVTPSCLTELLNLKSLYPMAPIVVGNSFIGPQIKLTGSYYPVIISPARVPELSVMSYKGNGITIGAACSLAMVRSILSEVMGQLPEDKSKMLRILLQQLSGQHIRSEASLGGSVLGESATWELNPILAVGNCIFNLASKDRTRKVTLRQLLFGDPVTEPLRPEELLISISIPFSKKGEFLAAFKQVQKWGISAPATVAAMSVLLKDGTDLILGMDIYYGGSESACLFAKTASQQLIGRRWNEAMLDEACKLFLGESPLRDSTLAIMVDYERTLTISFLFKFYLQVLQELCKMGNFQHSPVLDSPSPYAMFSKKNPVHDLEHRISNGFHLNGEVLSQRCEGFNGDYNPRMLQTIVEEEIDDEDSQAVEGELFLVFVTSTRHHAKIIAIHTTEALKAPGVFDVITASDVPGINDSDLFAEQKVHYIGQAICAVLADTKSHASLGASLIRIDYEDIEPIILSIQDAVKYNSLFEPLRKLEQGNLEEALETADHVFEGEDYIGGQEDILVHSNIIRVTPIIEDNEVEVFLSTHDPASIQAAVASALNIPSDYVVCHGGEEDLGTPCAYAACLAAITAVAAQKTGQPVQSVIGPREDTSITRHQPPFLGKYKVGYMNDGTIVALDVTYYCNAGHRVDESSNVLAVSLLSAQNAYYIPNTRCTVAACRTNTQSKTFCKGSGFPRASMLAEIWVDAIADRCNLSPEKVRWLNLHKSISQVAFKRDLDTSPLLACWNECLKKSSYNKRHETGIESNSQCPWKKKGFSIVPVMFPAGFIAHSLDQASVLVHVSVDGWVLVTPAGNETHQETNTKMMQVASRELRVPMSCIQIGEGSTTIASDTFISTSSVSSTAHVIAVQNACQILLQRLQPIINLNPDATWMDCVEEAFQLRISLSAAGYYRSADIESDWGGKEESPDFIFGAACSEVELDCRTGNHKCLRTDIVLDVGLDITRIINTEQIKGSFVYGLDMFTSEDFKYCLNGREYDQPEHTNQKKTPQQLNVTSLSSSINAYVTCSPKAVEETSAFLATSVFFALKDAVLSGRKDTGLPGTVSLPIPVRPQHVRIACGNHLLDTVQILNAD